MKVRLKKALKTIPVFAFLFAITLTSGCIDITGKYTKELKVKEKELAALRREIKENQNILDKKDTLLQQLAQLRAKISRVDEFIAKRTKK